MKKYFSIFTIQTGVIAVLSLLSAYIALTMQLRIHLDFLILGLLVVFPLTLTIKESYKRRERAIQYLSTLKATLQSLLYCSQNSKLGANKRNECKLIIVNVSTVLHDYLVNTTSDANAVRQSSKNIAAFIMENRSLFKGSLSIKLLIFLSKINDCIEYLIAAKRHPAALGLRTIALISIYSFVIFYPASLLDHTGFDVQLWYVFAMTAFKSVLLISLFNVQTLLQNPFDERGADSLQVSDFRLALTDAVDEK